MKQNKLEILQPDTFYHIYNRANGNEILFKSDENYSFFLRKYKQYISPICNTYCYCLMPNHFHFLIEIKSQAELELFFNQKTSSSITLQAKPDPQGFKNLEGLITQQFSNFFNCYVKAFNKQYNRKGSLLMHPFKRKKISTQQYLLQLVKYIHLNPVEAKLCSSSQLWDYSSYASLVSDKETLLMRSAVIEWFNDASNFKRVHQTELIDFDIDI